MLNKSIRAIAFYLPQFHPIPENDRWWGKGFTEWTNVAKARPLFPGHEQPHLPADLGFYDLRVPEVREAQADLARQYGIHGFCYYHYWFHGKRLLERPFNEVLASGQPDFPFCLCWANENWTRQWDGLEQEILMKQKYSKSDDLRHIRWLLHAFQDPRYVKIDGKPVFLVYRARKLPTPMETTEIWRQEARKAGFPDLFLCRVESYQEPREDPALVGFDAAVEFQPDGEFLGPPLKKSHYWQVLRKLRLSNPMFGKNWIFEYAAVVESMLRKPVPSYLCFPGVTPRWDNTARRKAGVSLLVESTPERYEYWLREVIRRFVPKSRTHNFVFINAWNEWAESAYLEPCRQWGRAYLEATRNAIISQPGT